MNLDEEYKTDIYIEDLLSNSVDMFMDLANATINLDDIKDHNFNSDNRDTIKTKLEDLLIHNTSDASDELDEKVNKFHKKFNSRRDYVDTLTQENPNISKTELGYFCLINCRTTIE